MNASCLINLLHRQLVDPNEMVSRAAGSNEFIQFCLKGYLITRLSMLNQKNHEKGDYGSQRRDEA